MGIALRLRQYLDDRHIDYDVLAHGFADTAAGLAEAAHVPGDHLVKGVVLKDDSGFLMAVLPATHHIDFDTIGERLGRPVQLATEDDTKAVFDDCEIGAIPPLGVAYGLDTIIEDSLPETGDLYFEAGDHKTLVQVRAKAFRQLVGNPVHGRFSFHD